MLPLQVIVSQSLSFEHRAASIIDTNIDSRSPMFDSAAIALLRRRFPDVYGDNFARECSTRPSTSGVQMNGQHGRLSRSRLVC